MGGDREMNPDSALAHKTRKRLMFYITENPGATFQTLKGVFKLNDGTLRYHLDYLRRTKNIKEVKKDNRRTFVPSEMRLDLYAPNSRRKELNNEQRRLLDLILQQPGLTRQELMERSRGSRIQLTYNLTRLNELGLIWKVKVKGRTGYSPITKKDFFKQAFAVLTEKLLDGEIDVDTYHELKRKLEIMLDDE